MKASLPAKKAASPLLLANIGQLLTLRAPGKSSGPRRGPELNDVGLIEDAAVFVKTEFMERSVLLDARIVDQNI